jgi:uncharacterized Rmd1/YagE family protein
MSKEQQKKAGFKFKRIPAYCVAEAFKMKIPAPFLKRKLPRDEALYVVCSYHQFVYGVSS